LLISIQLIAMARAGRAVCSPTTSEMLVNTILCWVCRGQNGPHDSQDRGSLLPIQTRPRIRNLLKGDVARAGFCIAHAADLRSSGRFSRFPGPSWESGLGF